MSKTLLERGVDIASQWEAISKSCSFCASHQMPCRYPNCGRKLLEEKLASSIWGKNGYSGYDQILQDDHS